MRSAVSREESSMFNFQYYTPQDTKFELPPISAGGVCVSLENKRVKVTFSFMIDPSAAHF